MHGVRNRGEFGGRNVTPPQLLTCRRPNHVRWDDEHEHENVKAVNALVHELLVLLVRFLHGHGLVVKHLPDASHVKHSSAPKDLRDLEEDALENGSAKDNCPVTTRDDGD